MNTETGISTKVSGATTSSTAEEDLYSKMDNSMRETSMKARKMEKVFTDGKMEMFIKGNLIVTKEKDLEDTSGTMDRFTEGNGGLIG